MVFAPALIVESATDVHPDLLREQGIEGVMVDVDDTLLSSREERVSDAHVAWLTTLRDDGFSLVLLSNGERARVARFAEQFGVPGFSLVGKPLPRAFRKGLDALGLPASSVAMIGDQVFTDVVGANLSGVTPILVRPLSAGKWLHTRLARYLERLILRGGDHGGPIHR